MQTTLEPPTIHYGVTKQSRDGIYFYNVAMTIIDLAINLWVSTEQCNDLVDQWIDQLLTKGYIEYQWHTYTTLDEEPTFYSELQPCYVS